jgi:simple sugar transport system permease protein
MIGACIGASVLGILEDGFHVISISSFAYDFVLGLAIVFAMVLNVQIERASSGSRRRGRGSFARAVNLAFARRGKAPVRR